MEDNSSFIWYLSVWIVAAGIVFFLQLRKGSTGSGLSLAYLLNLWIIHWVASALYALPQYSYYDSNIVFAGLEQSAYAVVAFSAGYLMLTFASRRSSLRQLADDKPQAPDKRPQISDARLTDLYIGIGAACFLLGISELGNLPT